MFGLFNKFFDFMGFKKKDVNILVIGLDNSGKSTILNHFKPEEDKSPDIVPTVGFNVEKFKSNEIIVCAFIFQKFREINPILKFSDFTNFFQLHNVKRTLS